MNSMNSLGYIGLGKMGQNMVERLIASGYGVTAYDPDAVARAAAVALGAAVTETPEAVLVGTPGSRTVWLMVPHQVVDTVLASLMPHLAAGDTVIDGGNSDYRLTVRRAAQLAEQGVVMLDVGTSGGPAGARDGACIMVGGDCAAYDAHKDLFRALAAPEAYGYMGLSGAGHFVKMVHNGIEYGMMQAIGEGFEILEACAVWYRCDGSSARLRAPERHRVAANRLARAGLPGAWAGTRRCERIGRGQRRGAVDRGDR